MIYQNDHHKKIVKKHNMLQIPILVYKIGWVKNLNISVTMSSHVSPT